MIVNKQKQIEFINDCGCIVDENELRNAILWYQEKPTAQNKHIYLHGRYPAVSIYREKVHIHRLLVMYWKNIKLLGRSYCVHHIDGNRLNATRENLELLPASKHLSLHNKGREPREEEVRRIKEINRRRANGNYPQETKEKISIAIRKRNAMLKGLKWEDNE